MDVDNNDIPQHMQCKRCRVNKIGRLQLIWCNDCALHLERRERKDQECPQ